MAIAARGFPLRSLRQVRQLGSRLSWGIADQGASSLTNFLLNIFVARTLGAEQFGAFTLAYVTYGVADNVSRGLSIEPLLVRFSASGLPAWRRATSGSTGTALLVGLGTGCCALAAGIVMGGTTGLAFCGLGLMLPALMLQDSWRYAFFAVGKGQHALLNDLLWAVVEIPLLLALKATGHRNVFWFVLAWGAGAAAGAAAGAFQARAIPSLSQSLGWLKAHRDLGPRFLVENVGTNGADTLRSYAVSSFLGLESVGYMQAATVLMGPFRIMSFGIGMITIPETARLMRRAPKKAVLYCVGVSAGQTALAVLWTVALLAGLPLGLGHLMLGALWKNAYPLVMPTALAVIASCVGSGASTGLHAMGAAKRSMRVALTIAVLSLSGAITGAALGSVLFALYLVAAAAWVGTVLYWLQLQLGLREAGTVPASSWRLPRLSGRRAKPDIIDLRRPLAKEDIAVALAAGTAVSRQVAAGSYGRETRDAKGHAVRGQTEQGGWMTTATALPAPRSQETGGRPGILLDRDGTIIVDHGYVGSVDKVEFIAGAAEAIARFNRANIPVAVVTNQAGVARGLYGLDDVTEVHRHIAEHLAKYEAHIDLFLFCPYHPDGVVAAFARPSEDRKPRPGMARAAAITLGLDLTASWVIGDRAEDIGLAQEVGASAVYLGPDDVDLPLVWSFPSLAVAAPFILERVAV